ncbi:MAG: hypothetical protein PHX62_04395 [Bacilli bacterium]|jgi:hypothetical protein|nr:hypothetical protein [Bacilli bacterium]
MTKLTHEQMMEKAWRFIHEIGITEDREEFENDASKIYFVENIYDVRDAYYNDLENGSTEDEDVMGFFNRHGIKYE